jgi:CspA family cold shock protein
MALSRSVVKWFDAKKGYGFLVHPETGEDVFVHYSQIVSDRRFKTLRTGQHVEYELANGTRGLHAVCIRPLDEVDDEEGVEAYPSQQ